MDCVSCVSCVSCVCVSEWVSVSEWVRVSECEWGGRTGRRRRRRTRSGYRTKNKNPTRQCGEKWFDVSKLLKWKGITTQKHNIFLDCCRDRVITPVWNVVFSSEARNLPNRPKYHTNQRTWRPWRLCFKTGTSIGNSTDYLTLRPRLPSGQKSFGCSKDAWKPFLPFAKLNISESGRKCAAESPPARDLWCRRCHLHIRRALPFLFWTFVQGFGFFSGFRSGKKTESQRQGICSWDLKGAHHGWGALKKPTCWYIWNHFETYSCSKKTTSLLAMVCPRKSEQTY